MHCNKQVTEIILSKLYRTFKWCRTFRPEVLCQLQYRSVLQSALQLTKTSWSIHPAPLEHMLYNLLKTISVSCNNVAVHSLQIIGKVGGGLLSGGLNSA